MQTKKTGSKVLTRSRGAEIVEGATEEKVIRPTLGEMTAVFEVQGMHDLSSCGFCQCFDPYLCKLHYKFTGSSQGISVF